MWIKLTNIRDDTLFRGDRIRVVLKPNQGEDRCVDFMVFHALTNASDGFSLLRISGYKAGHIGVTLPFESRKASDHGISTQWLRKNWRKWMPVDGKPNQIWINTRRNQARLL